MLGPHKYSSFLVRVQNTAFLSQLGTYSQRFLLFADSVIRAIRRHNLHVLKTLAGLAAHDAQEELGVLGLGSAPPESPNFVAPPHFRHSKLFRRDPNALRDGISKRKTRDEDIENSRRLVREPSLLTEAS